MVAVGVVVTIPWSVVPCVGTIVGALLSTGIGVPTAVPTVRVSLASANGMRFTGFTSVRIAAYATTPRLFVAGYSPSQWNRLKISMILKNVRPYRPMY